MIQLIPRVNHGALFPGSPQWYGVNNGQGFTDLSDGFGMHYARHPVSVAGTFRHLIIGCHVTHPSLTVTLLVNGVATALAVTLAAADTLAANTTHTVAVEAGDDVCYRIAGAAQGPPGLVHHNTCIAFEAAACTYGVTPYAGALAVGDVWTAGALGNGLWAVGARGDGTSNSFSLCAVPGTITRLDTRTYAGAPGAGSWVTRLRVNGVTQDGTGGTVDTTCTLTGAATQASSLFTLPVALRAVVDVELIRLGTSAPFAFAQVGCSVAFAPTEAGAFMLCGGSNDAISDTSPEYKWTRGVQTSLIEARAEAPIGPGGVRARGLYIKLRQTTPGAGLGRGSVYTLRRSGTATAIQVTVEDLAPDGDSTGDDAFTYGDTVTLQAAPFNTPIQTGFHWGVAMTAVPPVVPPDPLTIDVRHIRRLRRAPHLSHDHARIAYARFELDLERGVGLDGVGQGTEPLVELRCSRDGGFTWSEPVRLSAGRLGAYLVRAQAHRLGVGRDVVFEVVVSDPVAWSLVGAWLDLAPGTS